MSNHESLVGDKPYDYVSQMIKRSNAGQASVMAKAPDELIWDDENLDGLVWDDEPTAELKFDDEGDKPKKEKLSFIQYASQEAQDALAMGKAAVDEVEAIGREGAGQLLDQFANINQSMADVVTYFQQMGEGNPKVYKDIVQSFAPRLEMDIDFTKLEGAGVAEYIKNIFQGSVYDLQLKASKVRNNEMSVGPVRDTLEELGMMIDEEVPIGTELAALPISIIPGVAAFLGDIGLAFPRGYVQEEGNFLMKNLKGAEALASRLAWGKYFHSASKLGSRMKAGAVAVPLRLAETYARFDMPTNEWIKDAGYHFLFSWLAGKPVKTGKTSGTLQIKAKLGELARQEGDMVKAGEIAKGVFADLNDSSVTEVKLDLNKKLFEDAAELQQLEMMAKEAEGKVEEPFMTTSEKKVTEKRKVKTEELKVKADEKAKLKQEKDALKTKAIQAKEAALKDKDVEFPITTEKAKPVKKAEFTEKVEEAKRQEQVDAEQVKTDARLATERAEFETGKAKPKKSFSELQDQYVMSDEVKIEAEELFGTDKVTRDMRETIVDMKNPQFVAARKARETTRKEVDKTTKRVEDALKGEIESIRLEETLEAQRKAIADWKDAKANEQVQLDILEKTFKEGEVERGKQEAIRTEEQIDIPTSIERVPGLKRRYEEKVKQGREEAKFLEEELNEVERQTTRDSQILEQAERDAHNARKKLRQYDFEEMQETGRTGREFRSEEMRRRLLDDYKKTVEDAKKETNNESYAKFLARELDWIEGEVKTDAPKTTSKGEIEAKRLADLYEVEYRGVQEMLDDKVGYVFQDPISESSMLIPEGLMNSKGFRERLIKMRKALRKPKPSVQPLDTGRTKAEDAELRELIKEQEADYAGDVTDVEIKAETVEPVFDVFEKPISVDKAMNELTNQDILSKKIRDFMDEQGREMYSLPSQMDYGKVLENLRSVAKEMKDEGKSFPTFRERMMKMLPKLMLDPEARKLITQAWKDITEEVKFTPKNEKSDRVIKQRMIQKGKTKRPTIPVTENNLNNFVGKLVKDLKFGAVNQFFGAGTKRNFSFETRSRTMQRITDQNPGVKESFLGLEESFIQMHADVKRGGKVHREQIEVYEKMGADPMKVMDYAVTKSILEGEQHAKDTMDFMGRTEKTTLTQTEKLLYDYVNMIFETQYKLVNEARTRIGLPPLPFRKDYVTFYRVLEAAEAERVNLINAETAEINRLIDQVSHKRMSEQRLQFKKRAKKVTPIDWNISDIALKYFSTTELYRLTAPKRSMIYEIFGEYRESNTDMDALGKIVGPVGKEYNVGQRYPILTDFIKEYVDLAAGMKSNTEPLGLPNKAQQVALRMRKNIAVQALSTPITGIRQAGALTNTAGKIGSVNMAKGAMKWLTSKEARDESKKSNTITIRSAADEVLEGGRGRRELGYYEIIKGKELPGILGKTSRKVIEAQNKSMKLFVGMVDEVIAEMSWVGMKDYAVKIGESNPQRYADRGVIETQAVATKFLRAPIQDTIGGKVATTFQTFSINNIGYLLYDMAGVGKEGMKNSQRYKNGFKLVIGSAIINSIFEDVLGVNSPGWAPTRTFLKSMENDDTIWEMAYNQVTEAFLQVPMMGNVKYDSAVGGAVIDLVSDVYKVYKGEMTEQQALYNLGAKGYGIPMTKWFRNALRQLEEDGTPKDIGLGSPLIFNDADTRGMLQDFLSDDEPWKDVQIGE